jgi:hypothetical protein
MSGFFDAGEKINLEQSDVRISAENGLDFSQDQTIGIYIPPSVRYFSGKDTYLQFDAQIKGDIDHDRNSFATRLQLDPNIGANSLFSSLRVYAGNRETLLEENTEYASYVSVKYDYSKTDTEQKKRALREGCGVWTPATAGTLGTTKSIGNNFLYNPFMKVPNAGRSVNPDETLDTPWNDTDFIPAKITIPLHCGVFAENSKVFPNLLTNGCYIELVMAGARNLFRQMDGVLKERRMRLNPVFYGKANDGTKLTAGDEIDAVWCRAGVNNQRDPQMCPFVVGEKINFVKDTNNGDTTTTNTITLGKDGKGAVITDISNDGTLLKIGFDTTTKIKVADGMDQATENWFLYSESLTDATNYSPSCKVSNVELICHQIDMGDAYEKRMLGKVSQGGVVMFDIPSVGVQTHSQLQSDIQATIPLNLDYSKARGILALPTDASIYSTADQTSATGTYLIRKDKGALYQEDTLNRSNRTGISGVSNGLTKYNFFLQGKMVPSREISTKKTTDKRGGIDAHFISELEKGLLSCGIPANSFEEYASNFVIARQLAIGSKAVFDGRGKTARLNCKFEGTTDDQDKPSVNTLWKLFVKHTKTLVIKGDNIMVEQ